MEKFSKFNKRRAFDKAVGPGKKNPKLINVGPTFIPDYRVSFYLPKSCFRILVSYLEFYWITVSWFMEMADLQKTKF